jgi:hypothetical protein
MNDTVRHLAALAGYGRAQGYLELRRRANQGMRSEYFPVSALDCAATRARALGTQGDVYVSAAPRSRRAGTRSAVREGWVLWVDCDDVQAHERLRDFSPRPPLAIASGSGGTHAYWPLATPVEPERLEQANRRLALALGADRQSTDAARILRPAGTSNHKHSPPRPVQLRWFDEGVVVALEQVVSHLRDPSATVGGEGTVRRRDPAGDRLLAIPPSVYVPVLVGHPLNRDHKVPCPFHEDQTPSLHAFGRGRGWRCFGCGARGSIFDLAAGLWGLRTRGREFRELRRRLADTFDAPEAAAPLRPAQR